ncbi:ABATE domain-containing protein [Streptomyces leeuwenhoekii]|uniref:ABATE domain-containing protein n=1 Tax=Streptomyces leeuwenhoekii TaxID=1437453 RepID=UPI0034D1F432
MTDEAALPSAPGEDEHPALALANSAVALPGGHTADLLGTPAQAEQWLARRDLAPTSAGLAEGCATQLRSLRGQVRSLLASRVADQPRPARRRHGDQRRDDPRPHRIPAAVGREDRPLPRRAPPHHRDRRARPGGHRRDAADLLTSPTPPA